MWQLMVLASKLQNIYDIQLLKQHEFNPNYVYPSSYLWSAFVDIMDDGPLEGGPPEDLWTTPRKNQENSDRFYYQHLLSP